MVDGCIFYDNINDGNCSNEFIVRKTACVDVDRPLLKVQDGESVEKQTFER